MACGKTQSPDTKVRETKEPESFSIENSESPQCIELIATEFHVLNHNKVVVYDEVINRKEALSLASSLIECASPTKHLLVEVTGDSSTKVYNEISDMTSEFISKN